MVVKGSEITMKAGKMTVSTRVQVIYFYGFYVLKDFMTFWGGMIGFGQFELWIDGDYRLFVVIGIHWRWFYPLFPTSVVEFQWEIMGKSKLIIAIYRWHLRWKVNVCVPRGVIAVDECWNVREMVTFDGVLLWSVCLYDLEKLAWEELGTLDGYVLWVEIANGTFLSWKNNNENTWYAGEEPRTEFTVNLFVSTNRIVEYCLIIIIMYE